MRVTENMRASNMIANLFNNRALYDSLTEKLATQKKVNRASDDPLSATKIVSIQQSKATITQYTKNIDSSQTWISATESTLSGVFELLDTVDKLATENLTADALSQQTAAEYVGTIVDSLLSLANTKWGDRYLFSGTKEGVEPFSDIPLAASISATSNTISGAAINTATLLRNIDGYTDYQNTDYIHLEGTDAAGNAVSDDSFVLDDTTTMEELLNHIETVFGTTAVTGTATNSITYQTASVTLGTLVDTETIEIGGEVFEVLTGGGASIADGEFGDAAELAQAINANATLAAAGYSASEAGGVVTITRAGGDVDPAAIVGTADFTAAEVTAHEEIMSFNDGTTTYTGAAGIDTATAAANLQTAIRLGTNISPSSSVTASGAVTIYYNDAESDVTAFITSDGELKVGYNTAGASPLAVSISVRNADSSIDDTLKFEEVQTASNNTFSGAVYTSGIYTGNTNKTYVVKITQGGALGAAAYQISTDGGRTWNGTDTTMTGAITLGDGLQMNFEAGTFAVNDVFYVSANASGYYNGNDENLSATINDGSVFEYGISGAEAFTATGSGGVDIFESLSLLREALLNNDSTAILEQQEKIESAMTHILLCQSQCGMQASHLEVATNNLGTFDETLSNLLSDAQDADVTELAVKLKMSETALETSYAMAAKIGSLSILDYIK